MNAWAPGAVLLSHDFWKRHFGSDPTVVGRPYPTITGVLASGFCFPSDLAPHALVCQRATPQSGSVAMMTVIERPRPGVGAAGLAFVVRGRSVFRFGRYLLRFGARFLAPRLALNQALKSGAQAVAGGRGSQLRSVLVIAQVALALVLLVRQFMEALLERVGALPGVESAGITSGLRSRRIRQCLGDIVRRTTRAADAAAALHYGDRGDDRLLPRNRRQASDRPRFRPPRHSASAPCRCGE